MQDTYADLSERVEFLERMEEGSGEKFADVLREEIKELRIALATEIAASENGRIDRLRDSDASAYYSRPIYRHAFATSKPRRRSSSGRYYLYFALTGNTDGKPDTLTVYCVRHAGASDAFAISPPPARE